MPKKGIVRQIEGNKIKKIIPMFELLKSFAKLVIDGNL